MRWSLIPLLLLGGWFGYRLSSDLYGSSAGVLFLILWSFSPLILGWGATLCPGAVAAALGIPAVCSFRRLLHAPSHRNAIVAGICLGVLPLAKMTWIIAFGLWPLLWLFWRLSYWRKGGKEDRAAVPSVWDLLTVLLVGMGTLNVGYLGEGSFRQVEQFRFHSKLLTACQSLDDIPREGANRFSGTLVGLLPVPLPAAFVQGADTQRRDFENGFRSYLRGEWQDRGWWYYHLYVLLLKVPLGIICLLVLACGMTIFGRGYNAPWRDEIVVLAPGLAVLIVVSSQTGLSVHSRYIIPALPFFLIWTSKVARVFGTHTPFTYRRLLVAATVAGALTWSVGSSLWIYPHSLSYFNELTHGPHGGGDHLLGSNIDWGQDLPYFMDWLEKHPETALDGLALHDSRAGTVAGIPETPPPPWGLDADHAESDSSGPGSDVGPKPGWFALSVNRIYGRDGRYSYFLDFEPVAMAGYSVHIYYITLEDANRVRRDLGLPELREGWERDREPQ
jgi:hypothetical protein